MATGRVPTTANSPLTAKGDLFGYSTTQARVAVGNDGETLVADSSATTGLRWQGNFAAGKNILLNADFRINQRAFSSTTTSGTYTFDRWRYGTVGGTCTASAQTFTAGTAPVAGYEAINFIQMVTSGQSATSDLTYLTQRIEDVRAFANQTITVSFWAKANSGTPKIAVGYTQNFGSGGSASVSGAVGQVTLTTSWARYSVSVAIPSISSKTVGTSSFLELELWVSGGSDYNARTGSLGIQSNTFQIWGVQMEAGSVATAFQTATGTLAGELLACQRYYWRNTSGAAYGGYGWALAYDTTTTRGIVQNPVPMRIIPTSVDYGNLILAGWGVGNFTFSGFAISNESTQNVLVFESTGSTGLTAYRSYMLGNNNNTAGYFGVSAEL